MYLKRLTMKGFKSFASTTTLRLQPGMCCVVGPNGSGKSNVVDALAWVMGEHSARTLRGASMQDVIFSGAADRKPLGRAEVTLTIDNSDGAIPIEYAEVAITRRMFRDGASEYELNGKKCRLLDIQEVLSDAGIGREMHIIVGQGRLGAILESKPEDLRAFIEEAAGILKFRRRKDKAHRKLTAMHADLTRLGDLTAELHKQLGPLGKQAETARHSQAIQATLRDAQLRLLADDVTIAREKRDSSTGDTSELAGALATAKDHLAQCHTRITQVREELTTVEQNYTTITTNLAQLRAISVQTSATLTIASDRLERARTPVVAPTGSSVEELEEVKARTTEDIATLESSISALHTRMQAATFRVVEAERQHKQSVAAQLAAISAEGDHKAHLASLQASLEAATETLANQAGVHQRVNEAVQLAEQEKLAAEEKLVKETAHADAVQAPAIDTSGEEELSAAKTALAHAVENEKQLQAEINSVKGRRSAQAHALERFTRASHSGEDEVATVRGTLYDFLSVDAGYDKAVTAALDALLSATVHDANTGYIHPKGSTAIAVGGTDNAVPTTPDIDLPQGVVWAVDVLKVDHPLETVVAARLHHTVIAHTTELALEVTAAHRHVTAVTVAGLVVGFGWTYGGADTDRSGPTYFELQETLSQLDELVAQLTGRAEHAAAHTATCGQQLDQCTAAAEELRVQQAQRDTQAAMARQQLQHARKQRDKAIAAHAQALAASISSAEDKARMETKRDQLTAQLAQLQSHTPHTEAPTDEQISLLEQQVTASRTAQQDIAANLAGEKENLRRAEGKLHSVKSSIEHTTSQHARYTRELAHQHKSVAIHSRAQELAEKLISTIDGQIEVADRDAHQLGQNQTALREELNELLTAERDAALAVEKLDSQTARIAALQERYSEEVSRLEQSALDDYGVNPETLIKDFGPHKPLHPDPQQLEEYELACSRGEQVRKPAGDEYQRSEVKKIQQDCKRRLAELGTVNPLALEEFEALTERYNFLSSQYEDVRNARQEILDVIGDIEGRMETVFADAFEDVQRHFTDVFDILFPGGEASLTLTDPDNLLTTGIDIAVKPPGKRITRLSLLSGGEKSLSAIAYLVAIFKARPSPFYVMDEVEAALDDANLQRLVALMQNLQQDSQLIVITHQKTTMQAADVLYGVSMRGDGVSLVVSENMSQAIT